MTAGLCISSLSRPPSGFTHKPVATPPPPPAIVTNTAPLHPPPPTPPHPPPPPRLGPSSLPAPLRLTLVMLLLCPTTNINPRLSFVVQTSVHPVLLAPYRLTFPYPQLPPLPIYLSQTTLPTLAHWWISMQRTQLPHSYDRAPTHQPINLHQPTLYTHCTYSKPDMRKHGIIRLFQHLYTHRTRYDVVLT